MMLLVRLMTDLAMHGTIEQCAEIVAYGDEALRKGAAADPQLVEQLIYIANARIAELTGPAAIVGS